MNGKIFSEGGGGTERMREDEIFLHVYRTYFLFLQLSIDPRGLERGRVYFTSVKSYSAANPEKGCMFEVPITVVIPCVDLHHGYQYSW